MITSSCGYWDRISIMLTGGYSVLFIINISLLKEGSLIPSSISVHGVTERKTR